MYTFKVSMAPGPGWLNELGCWI